MTSNMTIVDRVVERLKTQPIGDLITEEDLHDIVKQAIPKTFFEPRTINNGSYRTENLPPLIIEVMERVLLKTVAQSVEKWINANEGDILSYWKEVSDKNLLAYVRKFEDIQATDMIRKVLQPLVNDYNSRNNTFIAL